MGTHRECLSVHSPTNFNRSAGPRLAAVGVWPVPSARLATVGAWPVQWARRATVRAWPVCWASSGHRGGVAGPLGPVWVSLYSLICDVIHTCRIVHTLTSDIITEIVELQ